MFGIGMSELIVILIIALIIFGPNKLPEIGKAFGKAISEFRSYAQNPEKKSVNKSENKDQKENA